MATDYRITADPRSKDKNAIKLRGGNLDMLRCREPQCVLAGPAECVHGDTIIEGTGKTIRWFAQEFIQPVVQTLHGPIKAGIPFRKGRAQIFIVETSDGKSFKATAKHLVLTPRGFSFVESLRIGESLVRYEPSRQASISDNARSAHDANVHHCKKTESDSQSNYPVCFCSCDEQPLAGKDNASILLPSQRDVRALDCDGCGMDASDDKAGHIHRHQLTGRRANDYCVRHECCGLTSSQVNSPSKKHGLFDALIQFYGRLRTMLNPLWPFAKQVFDEHDTDLSVESCACHKHQPASIHPAPWRIDDQVYSQYALDQDAWHTLQRWLQFGPLSDDDNLSCASYSAHLITVSNIKSAGEDDFYDLTVPEAHHYFAEGFIHHNTGKTFACCIKIHLAAQRYPGTQLAMVRKTYNSITGSVGKTFERVIKGAKVETVGGKFPTRYIYPNGSTIWVGGMDNPDRVLSSERDMIYVAQAEELTENDWETLSTRCTGRGTVAKNELGELIKPQLLGDCNPAGAKHWIKTKAAQGAIKLFNTAHKDNPTLFDDDGNITEQGKRSLAALGSLTGMRRKRLLEGIWATAEGAVYDMFDSAVHVRQRPIQDFRRWFITVDEGYTNPAVILLVGEDSDGRWHCLREYYKPGILQSVVVEQALEWFARPFMMQVELPDALRLLKCELAAVDESAAGLIADMVNAGIYAVGGKGRVLDGINRVQNRLKVQADGRPRYTIDPACVEHINEFESYVWKKNASSGVSRDEPEKQHDHSMDAIRYLGDALNEPTGAWDAAAIQAAQLPPPATANNLSLGGDNDGLELADLQIDV